MWCRSWLAERSKKAPAASHSRAAAGAWYCLCAVVWREAVTLGHKGADTAFQLRPGARVPPGPQVGTSGLKRADAVFS